MSRWAKLSVRKRKKADGERAERLTGGGTGCGRLLATVAEAAA